MGLLSDVSGSLIGLGIDAAFLLILRRIWLNTNKEAISIKNVQTLDKNGLESLYQSQDGHLPYICVEGDVQATGSPLTSLYDPDKQGVMRRVIKEEHRNKQIQGIWTNIKNTMVDTMQTVPFMLQSIFGWESTPEVHITDPESAAFFHDAMTTTHDNFDQWSGGAMSAAIHHISGDIPKGIHQTETMLVLGTKLLVIGELVYENGKLEMRPPQSGLKYVLTTLSKSEIVRRMENKSFWLKVVSIGTSLIGVLLLCRILMKMYKKWQADGFIDEVRRQRRARADARTDESNSEENDDDNALSSCVVCLSNPREIVLLNCGHLCLCADCLIELPTPLTCPICREPVVRHVTTYNP